jgi:hypothetical protein
LGRKHLVNALPAAIRQELSRRVFESNFSGYELHEAWLSDQGFRIGKSSLHRYYSAIERRELEKRDAEFAVMIGNSCANEGMNRNAALIVQIINPTTGKIVILTSAASSERIEAAVRGLA